MSPVPAHREEVQQFQHAQLQVVWMSFCACFCHPVALDKAVSETQPCCVKNEDNSLLLHREEMSSNQAE